MPELMYLQGYHYGLDLMIVLFSTELNSNTSSLSSVLVETEDRRIGKSGFVHILLDGCSGRYVVQMLREEGHSPWTVGHLRVSLNMCGDRAGIYRLRLSSSAKSLTRRQLS